MAGFLDEDWDRAKAEKPQAAAGFDGREDRRPEHVLEFILTLLFLAVSIPALIACLVTCWRFWRAVAQWCGGPGRDALRSQGPVLPWLLAALFAVLAWRRHAGRAVRT